MLLGEGENLSQRTNDMDLAAAACRAGTHFDTVDTGPDDIDRLRACGLVFQDLLQVGDLPAVEFWEIWMDLNTQVALSDPQFRGNFTRASRKASSFVAAIIYCWRCCHDGKQRGTS